MWQQQPLRWDTEYQCEMNCLAFASCNSVRWAWESPAGCDSFSVISIFFFSHLSRTFCAFCVVTPKCLFMRFWQVTTNFFTAFCKQLDSDIRRSSVRAETFEMGWHQGLCCVYMSPSVCRQSDSQKQEHFDRNTSGAGVWAAAWTNVSSGLCGFIFRCAGLGF